MVAFPTYIQPPSQPSGPREGHSPSQEIPNIGSDGQPVYWSPVQPGAIQNHQQRQQQGVYVTPNTVSIPQQYDFNAEGNGTRFNQNAATLQPKFLASGEEYSSGLGEFL